MSRELTTYITRDSSLRESVSRPDSDFPQAELFVTTNSKMIVGIPVSENEESILVFVPMVILPKTAYPNCYKKYTTADATLFYKSGLESRSLTDPRMERSYLSQMLSKYTENMGLLFEDHKKAYEHYCRRRVELEN